MADITITEVSTTGDWVKCTFSIDNSQHQIHGDPSLTPEQWLEYINGIAVSHEQEIDRQAQEAAASVPALSSLVGSSVQVVVPETPTDDEPDVDA